MDERTRGLPRNLGERWRRSTPLHKALLGTAALLLALIVALIVCELLGWPFLRAPLERRIEAASGRMATIAEPFELRLLGPIRVRTAGVALSGPAVPDGSWPGDMLSADRVQLALSWPALLRGAQPRAPWSFRELVVDELALDVRRDAQGRSNWSFDTVPKDARPDRPLREVLPRFDRLVVRNGTIQVDDVPLRLVASARVKTAEGLALTSTPPRASMPAPAASRAGSAAEGAARIGPPSGPLEAGDFGFELEATGRWRDQPLRLWLASSGVLPLVAEVDDPVPVRIDGQLGRARLQLDGQVGDALRLHALRGHFLLEGPSLAAVGAPLGVTLPTTAPFEMRGDVVKDAAVWQVAVQRLAVGSSRLQGRFRYDGAPAVPVLAGELSGERLALADLGPAFGTPAGAQPADTTPPGRVLPRRQFDIPSLRAMNADVQLDLGRVDLGTEALAELAPLRGRLRLADSVLTIDDLLARTADGQLAGRLSLDARNATTPRWGGDLQATNVRLERFVTLRNPRDRRAREGDAPAPTPAPPYVTGNLSASAQVRGTGRSTAEMLASLDGNVRLGVRGGQLSHLVLEAAGIDVAEGLGLLLGGDKPLPLRCAVAQLQVRNGVVRPEVALIDTEDTTLLLDGRLSLADETLALVVTARPHDFSPFTLRAPVRIEGTFADPAVRPDARKLTLKLGAAAALAALVSPLAALLPLIDLGEEDQRLCRDVLGARAAAAAARRAPAAAAPGAGR